MGEYIQKYKQLLTTQRTYANIRTLQPPPRKLHETTPTPEGNIWSIPERDNLYSEGYKAPPSERGEWVCTYPNDLTIRKHTREYLVRSNFRPHVTR